MPQTFYVKTTDDEGNDIYQEVKEIDPQDIDETVVKRHPIYESVLSESIQRRQTIKALKEQLAKDDEPQADAPAPSPAQAPAQAPAAPSINEDDFVNRVLERLTSMNNEASNRRNQLKAIAEKHKLGDDALPILEQSANPEATAEYIGRFSVSLSEATGGEAKGATTQDVVANALAKLGLTQS